MKVAVIGANGQLGSDVAGEYQAAGDFVVELTHAEIDIRFHGLGAECAERCPTGCDCEHGGDASPRCMRERTGSRLRRECYGSAEPGP